MWHLTTIDNYYLIENYSIDIILSQGGTTLVIYCRIFLPFPNLLGGILHKYGHDLHIFNLKLKHLIILLEDNACMLILFQSLLI